MKQKVLDAQFFFLLEKIIYSITHAANLKRVFSRFVGLFVQHGRGRRCRSVQDGKRNCRRHRDSDQDFWTAARAWATSCFESLEYGFPDQSVKEQIYKHTDTTLFIFHIREWPRYASRMAVGSYHTCDDLLPGVT